VVGLQIFDLHTIFQYKSSIWRFPGRLIGVSGGAGATPEFIYIYVFFLPLTVATCLLCTASLKKKKDDEKKTRDTKKRNRQRYANDIAAATMTVNLSGRAALFALSQHEDTKEHLTNLVQSERLQDKKTIPSELWRHSSFVCSGINLSNRRAVGLAANHVGGCLGMSAVAAFSRRSSFSIVPT